MRLCTATTEYLYYILVTVNVKSFFIIVLNDFFPIFFALEESQRGKSKEYYEDLNKLNTDQLRTRINLSKRFIYLLYGNRLLLVQNIKCHELQKYFVMKILK